nr:hypothetical protein [Rosenbergiella epipactidis]
MVRAILDGSKTQTRRVMKVQPVLNGSFYEVFGAGWSEGIRSVPAVAGHSLPANCPFGQVGDRLWVRETFTGHYLDDDQIQDIKDGRDRAIDLFEYRADYPNGSEAAEGWTPSSQMPRWASRITLEITDIRVERLRAISEGDAVKEGVPPAGDLLPNYPDTYLTPKGDFATAKVAFQRLWESIYGQDGWQSNPFVWVVEFKRVEAA